LGRLARNARQWACAETEKARRHNVSPLRVFEPSLFPESPGPYVLIARWSRADGQDGKLERPFYVGATGLGHRPEQARVAGVSLWSPSQWEAQLLPAHERSVLAALSRVVQQGDVVWDIGANLGIFALQFSQLVGPAGRVLCIEANPVCVYFLRANLETNAATNVDILPVAASDTARPVEFTINYDNSNLGLVRASCFFETKLGQRIVVDALPLDSLIDELQLPPPNVVKMDIEGAEAHAIAGLSRTLETQHVSLILELHGRAAARDTLALLDPLGYRYEIIESRKLYATGPALVAEMPEAPVQVLATRA